MIEIYSNTEQHINVNNHFFLLVSGSYFCYDNPAALQDTMMRDLSINEGQFMAFYSLYSWPNVILCMFGGYLIDKVFGTRLGAIVFGLIVTIGQVSNIYYHFNSYF